MLGGKVVCVFMCVCVCFCVCVRNQFPHIHTCVCSVVHASAVLSGIGSCTLTLGMSITEFIINNVMKSTVAESNLDMGLLTQQTFCCNPQHSGLSK